MSHAAGGVAKVIRAPVQQAQGPEFKPQYCQKQANKKKVTSFINNTIYIKKCPMITPAWAGRLSLYQIGLDLRKP
jgi:hypothetical protein